MSTKHLVIKNEVAFPVVVIGGEAIEATCETAFANIPAHCGLAFIIFQLGFVDLAKPLPNCSPFPVIKVVDGLEIEPNHIYLVPPYQPMFLKQGRFYQPPPTSTIEPHSFFDAFLEALATELVEKMSCVILSGSGNAGSIGLRRIHEMGGLVMVQEPTSAACPDMPQYALNTGLVDLVLPFEQLGLRLWHYLNSGFPIQPQPQTNSPENVTVSLHQIFKLLRTYTRHDFSMYKEKTVLRRIERRMVITQINQLSDYVDYLSYNAEEVEALLKELLIGVTAFFRNPETFQALNQWVLQKMLQSHSENQPIRIWVPACATGEEAYSIAMLLVEGLADLNYSVKIQIFATDIDRIAIEKARLGVYAEDVLNEVSPERLARFFYQQGEGEKYRINKEIRDMVIFAVQNVIHEPPFSRLDLISCRNLLIYLKPELQQKILALFHYALIPEGFLFLGTSETLRELSHYFRPIQRPYNLFQCLPISPSLQTVLNFPTSLSISPRRHEIEVSLDKADKPDKVINHRQFLENLLLNSYAPPCVIVNEKYNILYIHGRIGKYIDPSTGEATWNIMHLAAAGLKIPLMTGLRKVFTEQKKLVYERVPLENKGTTETINLIFHPIADPVYLQGLAVVIFAEAPLVESTPSTSKAAIFAETDYSQVIQLEGELSAIHERLQTTVEELETSNEELQVFNEALQASNEELQTSNEELHTAKEELQSNNEELQAINAELKLKGQELTIVNGDLENLLTNVDMGVIFLDRFGFIRRSNPTIALILNLTNVILGQSFPKMLAEPYLFLGKAVQEVLKTAQRQSLEFLAPNGVYYLGHIYPLKTAHNTIDGVVIALADITLQKQSEFELQQHREHLEKLVVERTVELAETNSRLLAQMAEREQIEAALRRSREQLLYDNLHDNLTGLPNRKMFKQQIEQAIEQGRQHLFAVMFLDLNRFKSINDSLGHQAGDELLIKVAKRLQDSLLTKEAIVARLAGDEFGLLLTTLFKPEMAWQQAQHVIQLFTQPFDIAGYKVFITTSIGITLSSTPFENAEDLLHQADKAMFIAKYKHQGWVELFKPYEANHSLEHLKLENELWEALKLNQLELYYQPIIDLSQNKMVAVEALIRWQHPRLGLLQPEDFLELAETAGLIISLDQWVLRTACSQLKRWHGLGYPIGLAFNLSILTLRQAVMGDFIEQTLQEFELVPSKLTLEVTERTTSEDLALVRPVLDQLQGLGVKLSLDDFGAGHSSLKHLELLNLDFVKIDSSFIAQIGQNPKAELIISTLIDLAEQFNLIVVAEGVETKAQLAFLKAKKCRDAQGFLFSEALSAADLLAQLGGK